ncbi:MAG: hypothetical protein SYC29_16845 [Planctomycetota bacterium]|nr:hypothetical protein [Planctomycetota bacterium]
MNRLLPSPKRLVSALVGLLMMTAATGAQQLYIPEIPRATHSDFLAALDLNDDERRLADLAYEAYLADRAETDRAYSTRRQWISTHSPRRLEADDPELVERIASGQRELELIWHHTIDLIESRYFEALGALSIDPDRLTAAQRRWRRQWLMESYHLPADQMTGSTLDLSRALADARIDVPSSPQLAALRESYEAEVDNVLGRLRWTLAMRGLQDRPALELANAAVVEGDRAAVERHLNEYLHTESADGAARRQCAALRAINLRYAAEMQASLAWEDALRLRAVINRPLYGYLYDAFAPAPERIIADVLRSPAARDEKVMAALRDFDARYERRFRSMIGDLDESYQRAYGPQAMRAEAYDHFMRQISEAARGFGHDFAYEPPDEQVWAREDFETELQAAREFVRSAARQVRELAGGGER